MRLLWLVLMVGALILVGYAVSRSAAKTKKKKRG